MRVAYTAGDANSLSKAWREARAAGMIVSSTRDGVRSDGDDGPLTMFADEATIRCASAVADNGDADIRLVTSWNGSITGV